MGKNATEGLKPMKRKCAWKYNNACYYIPTLGRKQRSKVGTKNAARLHICFVHFTLMNTAVIYAACINSAIVIGLLN